MALTESQLGNLTSAVAGRITGTILGREARAPGLSKWRSPGQAVAFCNEIAPNAPLAILREAAIRLAGWLYGNRPHVAEHEITDPSGTTVKLKFNNTAATANGWRSSGASALLSRLRGAPGRSDWLMWPFNRRETRQATGGTYTGIISALIDLQASRHHPKDECDGGAGSGCRGVVSGIRRLHRRRAGRRAGGAHTANAGADRP